MNIFYYFCFKQTVKFYSVVTPVTNIMYFPTTIDKLPFIVESKEITNDEIVKVIPFEVR